MLVTEYLVQLVSDLQYYVPKECKDKYNHYKPCSVCDYNSVGPCPSAHGSACLGTRSGGCGSIGSSSHSVVVPAQHVA